MSPPTLFVSYSSRDKVWKDRVVGHLKILEATGEVHVRIWDDEKIPAGNLWFQEIQKNLDQARIAILLISVDFLNSKFIQTEEVPIILERRRRDGLTIFPIILKSCSWRRIPWLQSLEVRPFDGRPLAGRKASRVDSELTAMADELAELIGIDFPHSQEGLRHTERLAQLPLVKQPNIMEVAIYLQGHLGGNLTAYISGVSSVASVSRWMAGESQPSRLSNLRMRAAYPATRMIVGCFDSETAQSWFLAANPRLENDDPASFIRKIDNPNDWIAIFNAAQAFLEAIP